VFWFGDLNFRMDELSASDVKSRIAGGDIQSLWKYDQVSKHVNEVEPQLTSVDNVLTYALC